MYSSVNPIDYGADPSGTSDSLIAFRNARDNLFPGGTMWSPADSVFKFSSLGGFDPGGKPMRMAGGFRIVIDASVTNEGLILRNKSDSGFILDGIGIEEINPTAGIRVMAVKIGSPGQISNDRPEDATFLRPRLKAISGSSFLVRTGKNIRIIAPDFDTSSAPAGADTNDIEVAKHDVKGLWIIDGNSVAAGNLSDRSQNFLDLEPTQAPATGADDIIDVIARGNTAKGHNTAFDVGTGAGAKAIRGLRIEGNNVHGAGYPVMFSGGSPITDAYVGGNTGIGCVNRPAYGQFIVGGPSAGVLSWYSGAALGSGPWFMGASGYGSAEDAFIRRIARHCRTGYMRNKLSASPGSGKSTSFRLRSDYADTGLIVAVANGAHEGDGWFHVPLLAGANVSVRRDFSGGPTASTSWTELELLADM